MTGHKSFEALSARFDPAQRAKIHAAKLRLRRKMPAYDTQGLSEACDFDQGKEERASVHKVAVAPPPVPRKSCSR